ncbi:MAG: ParB/RepB/Spo0J family partition protein [Acetobacter syzygii]|uniref:ParB/RepB/Spo0J family partition protein n=1 Tax=Acetobacter syzygii TaxID=146476 RepID=UPI0039ED3C81
MELRKVDPKSLLDNPDNPRQGPPNQDLDRQLALNIKSLGLIQLPLVREMEDGRLMIIAGHRRRRACVMAKLKEIHVLVAKSDEKLDRMKAGSENMIRQAMSQSEQWKFVDTARRDEGWTESRICKTLMVTPAYLKRLSLLANLHQPILHAIDQGKGPDYHELKVIAGATVDDQRALWAEVWQDSVEEGEDPAEYRLKPEDDKESVPWFDMARQLEHNRYYAADARFDDVMAKEHGIVWMEDLFGEGDQDNRYTEDRGAYAAAQSDWLDRFAPEGVLVIGSDDNGRMDIPDEYNLVQSWMSGKEDDITGYYLNRNSLKVVECKLRHTPHQGSDRAATRSRTSTAGTGEGTGPTKERAPISGTGEAMIGQTRTQALDMALEKATATVDPWELVAALLLAFGSDNVTVHGDSSFSGYGDTARHRALRVLFPEGYLVRDETLLREQAMAAVRGVVNCDVSIHHGSGTPAMLLGSMFNADAHMPNMAVEEFLKTFSKAGIMVEGKVLGLDEKPTGKLMREAMMRCIGADGHWVPAAAGFAPAVQSWAYDIKRSQTRAAAISDILSSEEDDDDAMSDQSDDCDKGALVEAVAPGAQDNDAGSSELAADTLEAA